MPAPSACYYSGFRLLFPRCPSWPEPLLLRDHSDNGRTPPTTTASLFSTLSLFPFPKSFLINVRWGKKKDLNLLFKKKHPENNRPSLLLGMISTSNPILLPPGNYGLIFNIASCLCNCLVIGLFATSSTLTPDPTSLLTTKQTARNKLTGLAFLSLGIAQALAVALC